MNEAPTMNPDGPFAVDENSAAGTVVGSVSSADQDAGDTVSYSITAGNTGGAFTIDSGTGQITVANTAALDFETLSSFTLTVQVSDSGGLTDSTPVTVNLNDINDAPIDITITGGTVAENSANGTLVAAVNALDVDAGDTVTWTLIDDANGRFTIDTVSGAITVADGIQLDFETNATHSITVQATDSGGLPYVEGFVTNVNEAPAAQDDTVQAKQLETVFYTPSTILVNDSDVDGNGITAILMTGPDNGSLVLNADGTFEYTPDDTFFGTDSFTYQATDGSLNSAAVTVTLNVTPAASPPTGDGDGSDGDDSDGDTASDADSDGETNPDGDASSGSGKSSSNSATEAAVVLREVDDDLMPAASSSEFLTDIFLDRVPEAFWGSDMSAIRTAITDADPFVKAVVNTVFGSVVPGGPAFSSLFLEFGGAGHGAHQHDAIADLEFHEKLVVGTSVAVSTSFSVGYVIWMLRGGSLMAAFMSSLPAWQSFDPLTIIDNHSAGDFSEEDEETLESLVSSGNR